MSVDPLAAWWNLTVIIERRTGTGAAGDQYAAPSSELGFVDDNDKLILGPDGREVISSSRVYMPAATIAVPVGSRVTLPATSGAARRSIVLTSSLNTSGGLGTPDHVELALQ